MKKILIGIGTFLVILIAGAAIWYHNAYGGESYYVHITADGTKTKVKADDGAKWDEWNYEIPGYTKQGSKKDLEFRADHNLRHDAYLDVTYNNSKGVTEWHEVKAKEVPEIAMNALKS